MTVTAKQEFMLADKRGNNTGRISVEYDESSDRASLYLCKIFDTTTKDEDSIRLKITNEKTALIILMVLKYQTTRLMSIPLDIHAIKGLLPFEVNKRSCAGGIDCDAAPSSTESIIGHDCVNLCDTAVIHDLHHSVVALRPKDACPPHPDIFAQLVSRDGEGELIFLTDYNDTYCMEWRKVMESFDVYTLKHGVTLPIDLSTGKSFPSISQTRNMRENATKKKETLPAEKRQEKEHERKKEGPEIRGGGKKAVVATDSPVVTKKHQTNEKAAASPRKKNDKDPKDSVKKKSKEATKADKRKTDIGGEKPKKKRNFVLTVDKDHHDSSMKVSKKPRHMCKDETNSENESW